MYHNESIVSWYNELLIHLTEHFPHHFFKSVSLREFRGSLENVYIFLIAYGFLCLDSFKGPGGEALNCFYSRLFGLQSKMLIKAVNFFSNCMQGLRYHH